MIFGFSCPASDFLRQLKVGLWPELKESDEPTTGQPVEEELRIVVAVLRGEVSIKEADRRERVSALGEAHVELRVWRKGRGLPGFQELEVIRAEAGLSVTRMCQLLGMPRATW